MDVKRGKMPATLLPDTPSPSLLQLPDTALLNVLRNLDAVGLASMAQTSSYFTRKDPVTLLPLTQHVARQQVFDRCAGNVETASRFRNMSWTQRLHLEDDTGCGFDKEWCEQAGFQFQLCPDAIEPPSVKLVGMGPKLLLSDVSTAEQTTLRWRLRVRGNTAVEFGCVPTSLPLSHTALHKCLSAPDLSDDRCMGFCSQITAGSLLPVKVPVMRGCVLDIVAKKGSLKVLVVYPPNAKEITWQNGQPVQRAYRGPSRLTFEQEFSDAYDIRLAVTSWAKASFEVLHTGFNRVPRDHAECVGTSMTTPVVHSADMDTRASPMLLFRGVPAIAAQEPSTPPMMAPATMPVSIPTSVSELASLELPEFACDVTSDAPPSSGMLNLPFSTSVSPPPGLAHSDSRVTMCLDGQVDECSHERRSQAQG